MIYLEELGDKHRHFLPSAWRVTFCAIYKIKYSEQQGRSNDFSGTGMIHINSGVVQGFDLNSGVNQK